MEVFDFETIRKNGEIVPYALSYSCREKIIYVKIEGSSKKSAAKFILKNFDPKIYYAHNLLFDFLQFFEGLISMKIKFKWLFTNNVLFGVSIEGEKGTIHLKCSYRLIPFALDRFYPSLTQLKKLTFPYKELEDWDGKKCCKEFDCIEKDYHNLTLESYLEIYASRDALILKDGLNNLWKNLNHLNLSLTRGTFSIGGLGLKFYIKNWNQINLNLNNPIKDLVRKAYFGGRCEVYGNPKEWEKILHFDFKGMYQQCMNEKLPFNNLSIVTDLITNDIEEPGFYYVEIEYYLNIPILPSKGDKLYFKEGIVRGWYWYEEILEVFKWSKVVYLKVYHKIVAKEYDNVLTPFLDHLNKLREEGGIKGQIGKLFINSFYGRLGIKDEMMLLELVRGENQNLDYGRIGDLLVKRKTKKSAKGNIAMAAAITAKGRLKLYRGFKEVEKEGGRVLYCDTDSIFAAFPKDKKVEDKWLGEVYFDTNKRDTVIKEAIFVAPKLYALILKDGTEVIKIKGINRNELTFKELKKSFLEGKGLNLKSLIFGKKNLKLDIFIQEKFLSTEYKKRKWNKGKTETNPLVH